MTKQYLITVGILGALGVFLGIFITQIISGNVSTPKLIGWILASSIQMIHTLALLAMAFMNRYAKRAYLKTIYYLFVIGIGMYSGAMYLISVSELSGASQDAIGLLKIVAPMGGILLMIGWIMIIASGITYVHHKRGHKKSDGFDKV